MDSSKPELSACEQAELNSRGYEILKKLGQGKTREVYLARYSQGPVSKLRTVKISRLEVDSDSIATRINKAKRDVDLAEVYASNQIQHPYIAEVVDSFRVQGRTVNVEGYYPGTDLEHLVKEEGPITDNERFQDIFSKVLSAVEYLHTEAGLLHRDIKPLNILVTERGNVLLADLQNAIQMDVVRPEALPVRGGTAYTHPDLLNALVTGKPAAASVRTDLYAVGATMYYALTGSSPFEYRIAEDPKGRELRLDESVLRVGLFYGNEPLKSVTPSHHERRLTSALDQMPRRYRVVLQRCLTLNVEDAYNDAGEVWQAIERLEFRHTFKDAALQGTRYALPAAVVLTAIALSSSICGSINGKLTSGETSTSSTSTYECVDLNALLHEGVQGSGPRALPGLR